MEPTKELRKWVEILSTAEKRFVKLLGKARAGSKDSQQLELFDWINQSQTGDILPVNSGFAQNFATVSNRLKDLILDSLRLLHKADDTDAVLRTMLDEIAILISKKHYTPALRHIRRAKSMANDRSRYNFVLQCIEAEQKIRVLSSRGDSSEMLGKLRDEEKKALEDLQNLRELHYRHEKIQSLIKLSPYSRDNEMRKQADMLSEGEIISHYATYGSYTEKALAINILGIRDLYIRDAMPALLRYQQLLREWQSRPDWQIDQLSLLLLICKFYQSACFFCPVDWDVAKEYITMVNHFKNLPPDAERDFQRILYHNQFILSLNSGNLEYAQSLITEIDKWISKEQKHLTEAQQLSFLCNFAVTAFLNSRFHEANNYVIRIIQMPDKNARKDIRAFAFMLQAVVHFELGNSELNEYITRAGKRRFGSSSSSSNFEALVFNMLQKLLVNKQPQKEILNLFLADLETFSDTADDSIPLLGLKEIYLWAQSKLKHQPLKELFLTEVKNNLALLEQKEKVG
jgi:hypothetical protein